MMIRDIAFLRRFLCVALIFVSTVLPIVAQSYIEQCINSFVRWEASADDFTINHNALSSLGDIRLNQQYQSIVFIRKGNQFEVYNIQDKADRHTLQSIANLILPTTPTPEEDRIEFEQTETGVDILHRRPSSSLTFLSRATFPNEGPKETLQTTNSEPLGSTNSLGSMRLRSGTEYSAYTSDTNSMKDFVEPAIDVSWDENEFSKRLRYPQFLRYSNVEGNIALRLLISDQGSIQKVVILNANHSEFLLSTLVALQDFPFSPANDGVKNIRQWTTLPVRFALR